MAGITHTKVSAKSDGADATLVLPSDWNADHTVGDLGGTPNVSLATTNAAGNDTTYLRTDDQLALFDATVPVTQAFGDSAGAGVASVAARRDHKHAMPAVTVLGGTPAPVLSSSAAAGNATTYLRTNDQIALFDATVPSGTTQAGVVGTAAFAARRDHQHPTSVSKVGMRIFDDMMYPFNPAPATNTMMGQLLLSISGTAAGPLFTTGGTTVSHPGITGLQTGSTSTGRTTLFSGNDAIVLGGGRARYGVWVMIPVLGTSAQRFEVDLGFIDATAAASAVDGCFFHYLDTLNSGAWSVTTVSNSTSTATGAISTGITPVAGTWYLLECEVNAAGSSVTYTVDGANPVTHIANIPASRATGFYLNIIKSVGATTSYVDIDAYYLELDFTTPR